MPHEDSVSVLLDGLKAGNHEDIQRLWDRYFGRLVRLAGAKLPGHAKRAYDEEDVAISAFHSFCARVEQGQFPKLDNRDDLWRVLATITARKVIGVMRYQNRQKRGGGNVFGESALVGSDDASLDGMARFFSSDPTPEVAAQFAEEYAQLFARLEDDKLRQIAQRKLDGHSSAEIALELGTSTRTVDRKIRLIRALWEQEA